MTVMHKDDIIPEKKLEERKLLKAIQEGDQEAFWELWMRYSTSLYKRCLRRMNGNHNEAEDIMGDCMLKARQRIQDYAGDIRNVEAWLTSLVNNHCIDIFRQRKNTLVVGDETGLLECSSQEAKPDQHMISSESMSITLRLAAQLSTSLKEPFVLHFIEGRSYDEVAQICGISLSNVRKRIQLARDDLKTNMVAANQGRMVQQDKLQLSDLLDVHKVADSEEEKLGLKVVRTMLPNGIVRNYHLYQEETDGKAPSITALKRYVKKHPSGWKKRLALAQTLEMEGHWEEAVNHYRTTLVKRPSDTGILLKLARLLVLNGQSVEAVKLLKGSVITKDPKGLTLIAEAYCIEGKWREAQAVYGKILKSHPENLDAHYKLCLCLFRSGQIREGAARIKDVLTHFPNHLPTLTLHLEFFCFSQDSDLFLEKIENILEQDPFHPMAHKYWLDFHLARGTRPKAFKERMARLVSTASCSPYYMQTYWQYESSRGQMAIDEPIKDFVTEHPNLPSAWYYLAENYAKTNKVKAKHALERANNLSQSLSLPAENAELELEDLGEHLKQSILLSVAQDVL